MDKDKLMQFFDEKHLTISSSGHIYKNTRVGIIPQFLIAYFKNKDLYGEKMKKANQMYQDTKDPKWKAEHKKYKTFRAIAKLILNSTYGIVANQYSRFYNIGVAESVTTSSKFTILASEAYLNEYFNEHLYKDDVDFMAILHKHGIDTINLRKDDLVVAIDTDSLIFEMEDILSNFNIKDEEIVPLILELAGVMQNYLNNRMEKELKQDTYKSISPFPIDFKQEMIGSSGLFLAKKKYALHKINEEGVAVDKMELKGIDVVKSTTPEIVKQPIKNIIDIILKNPLSSSMDSIIKVIEDTRKILLNAKSSDIAIPMYLKYYSKYTIGGIDDSADDEDDYDDEDSTVSPDGTEQFGSHTANAQFLVKKQTPYHAKGSVYYNKLLDRLDLPYDPIRGREYIKVLYIHPIEGYDVISFKDILPEEIEEIIKINTQLQVEKIFIEKVRLILKACGLDGILCSNSAKDLF